MKFHLLLMFALANMALGSTAEGDSAVVAEVTPRIPTYSVRGYEIEGNTVFSPEQIDGVLTNFIGPTLTLARLQQGLFELQSLYSRAGHPKAGVSLPHQDLTNGIVRLIVTESRSDLVQSESHPAILTNTLASETSAGTVMNPPAKPVAQTFAVRGYLIEGNTVLSQEKIDAVLTNYTGDAVDLGRLREGLGELQLLYRHLGFATISVTLPQQQLTNDLVRVRVTEGRISDITITGNRYFSSNNVRRALPSLTTNLLLNTKWFQPELDRANASQDRQIYPVVSPGPEPGTTALALKIKDRLPLHGHIEVNNRSTTDTPPLRIDASLQYNNLWQRDQQIGLQYNFSPQNFKSDDQSLNFLDLPLVASYSAFYRLPLGFGSSATLREEYDRLPVDFGYDQITHSFRLPLPTGNPELIVYASRSDADTFLRRGPVTAITNTPLADISSQFVGRNPSVTENIGARLTVPVSQFADVRSSFSLGLDYKHYAAQTFSTNLTFFKLYALDEFGNRVLVREEIIPLDANSHVELDYLPFSLGWSAVRPDKWGSTSFTYNQSLFLAALGSDRKHFQSVAGAANAGGNYTTLTATLAREQKLPKDCSLLLRANGQWASAPLIGNEQFALGGTGGVRGYDEGQTYGDTGWRVMFDLRAPPLEIGSLPHGQGDIPVQARCSWFMDYGEAYLIERPASPNDTVEQWGTGVGFYVTAGPHLDARLTLGWALCDAPGTPAGGARAYFSVGCQF